MKRTVWITILAIIAFAVILIARMPVSWISGFIPKDISCTELAGTVWNGSCTGLVAQNMPVGDAAWELQALPLFTGKVAAFINVTSGQNFVRGDIETSMSGDKITARDLQADMPLDPKLFSQLPRGLSGVVRVNLASLLVEKNTVLAVEGLIEAHNLVQKSGSQPMAIGDYSVTFPAADPSKEPVGELRSLSGPLNVEGTLKLTREPGFVLEGLVAAGPDAAPQLAKELSYLGQPDAQGRRPFSVAATF